MIKTPEMMKPGAASGPADAGRGQNAPEKKKEPDTKRLAVPASVMLRHLAGRDDTAYPVALVLLDRRGGASYTLDTPDEALSIAGAASVLMANVIRVSYAGGTAHIDARKDGWLIAGINEYPGYSDRQMIAPGDIGEVVLEAMGRASA